jgi:hypothetical protein
LAHARKGGRQMNTIRGRKTTPARTDPAATEQLNAPLMVDEKTAAFLVGVSVSFLRKSRAEGQHGQRTAGPRFVSVGGRRLYRRSDLFVWVENLAAHDSIADEGVGA